MPKPKSYVDQTKEAILEGIASGTWKNTLPPVRMLCQTMRVSYPTLHTALSQLDQDKIIKLSQGKPTQILSSEILSGKKSSLKKITLLSPSISMIRADFELLVNQLRELLNEAGFILKWRVIERLGDKVSKTFLNRLVESDGAAGFILVRSSKSVQEYFQESRFPSMVIGSLQQGVALPYVEMCHHAPARHAAGKFRALGHKYALFLTPEDAGMGDDEAMKSFISTFKADDQHEVSLLRHEWIPEYIERKVLGYVSLAVPPTAIYIVDPYVALTVLFTLLKSGFHVPEDFSIITSSHDPFVEWTLPGISHYSVDYCMAGKTCAQIIEACFESNTRANTSKLLLPEYVELGSVGPAPA